jgi:hypothetical protein
MGMEVVGAEIAPAEVKVSDGEVNLFQEKESKATAKEREEAAVFGLETTTNVTDLAPPKDVKDEWPEPKQTHAFYFVKVRSFEDPKLRAKLELADKEFQKKIQARSKIIEAVRAKKVLFLLVLIGVGSSLLMHCSHQQSVSCLVPCSNSRE